ncbi:MAG: Crp/Fnr family transcriptional regulator [Pyrinomonadaceae bacterium]
MGSINVCQTENRNAILEALSGQEYEKLNPHLETVDLPPGQNLYNCGDTIRYVYFPLDAVIYLFTTMEDGATIETGIIGSEGVLGISAILGAKTTTCQALALSHNSALRIRVELLKKEFDTGGMLHNLVLRYFHALYVQMSQTAACNRHHNMEGRLCRWLLMMHDRNQSDDLQVTQEFISEMLGTRRPYVTTAAGLLQTENIIECSRGHIRILDREALEDCCCECYEIIRDEFRELLVAPNERKPEMFH